MARKPKAATSNEPAASVDDLLPALSDVAAPVRRGRKPKAEALPEPLAMMDSDDAVGGTVDADATIADPTAAPIRKRPGPKPKPRAVAWYMDRRKQFQRLKKFQSRVLDGVGAWTRARAAGGLDPQGSASDGDGLGGADHAVEHLDSEGDLAVLSGPATGPQLGPDQVLGALHGGFCLVAQAVLGRPLPPDAAPFGHVRRTSRFDELDVTVARRLPIRVSCAQHGVGAAWDDHLDR